jgi:hypothetical protein
VDTTGAHPWSERRRRRSSRGTFGIPPSSTRPTASLQKRKDGLRCMRACDIVGPFQNEVLSRLRLRAFKKSPSTFGTPRLFSFTIFSRFKPVCRNDVDRHRRGRCCGRLLRLWIRRRPRRDHSAHAHQSSRGRAASARRRGSGFGGRGCGAPRQAARDDTALVRAAAAARERRGDRWRTAGARETRSELGRVRRAQSSVRQSDVAPPSPFFWLSICHRSFVHMSFVSIPGASSTTRSANQRVHSHARVGCTPRCLP